MTAALGYRELRYGAVTARERAGSSCPVALRKPPLCVLCHLSALRFCFCFFSASLRLRGEKIGVKRAAMPRYAIASASVGYIAISDCTPVI